MLKRGVASALVVLSVAGLSLLGAPDASAYCLTAEGAIPSEDYICQVYYTHQDKWCEHPQTPDCSEPPPEYEDCSVQGPPCGENPIPDELEPVWHSVWDMIRGLLPI